MLIERMRKRLAVDRASFIEPCLPSPADKPPSGWFALPVGAFPRLAEVQESVSTGGEA